MKKTIIQTFKNFCLFFIGGVLYLIIELLWRGYSHWSMLILGGICLVIIGSLNEYLYWEMDLLLQMLCGSLIITILEFVTGYIVNILLGWNIWDYSHMPFNFMGQICLLYTFLWLLLSLPVILLDDYLRWKLFNEEKPHYKIFGYQLVLCY